MAPVEHIVHNLDQPYPEAAKSTINEHICGKQHLKYLGIILLAKRSAQVPHILTNDLHHSIHTDIDIRSAPCAASSAQTLTPSFSYSSVQPTSDSRSFFSASKSESSATRASPRAHPAPPIRARTSQRDAKGELPPVSRSPWHRCDHPCQAGNPWRLKILCAQIDAFVMSSVIKSGKKNRVKTVKEGDKIGEQEFESSADYHQETKRRSIVLDMKIRQENVWEYENMTSPALIVAVGRKSSSSYRCSVLPRDPAASPKPHCFPETPFLPQNPATSPSTHMIK
ncbi:hypothetical protein HW555_001419 [Spodoptera exigua]|uniref:Uncharacterized protein n=1 Tax=Spodoptera exigua TaxID=7107 RepID=A0A835GRM3_SPOEX|nr:hypothetical protein HW555_001419 [Spodoptera exigua]